MTTEPDLLHIQRLSYSPVVVRFARWDPHSRLVHWDDEEHHFNECTGRDCVWCLKGELVSLRVQLPVECQGEERRIDVPRGWYTTILAHKARERRFLTMNWELSRPDEWQRGLIMRRA